MKIYCILEQILEQKQTYMNNNPQSKPGSRKKYLMIFANIFPLFAVIFLEWSIFELIFVYFSETFLFLILSLVKFYFLKIPIGSKIAQSLLYLLFFSVFMAFIGGVLFLFYFAELEKKYVDASFSEIIVLIFSVSYFISLILFLASDIYYFVKNFIKKEEYLNHTTKTLIREPGLRIWILLMTVFLSIGIIKVNLVDSIAVILVFIVLKTLLDFLIFKEKKNNVDIRELYDKETKA